MAIRPPTTSEIPELFDLMRALARYEKLPPPDAAAARRIRAAIQRGEPRLHPLLAFDHQRPVGYALYFFTFSSFLARPTLYLEDLFVLPELRGCGWGRRLFAACIRVAKKQRCGRMEWAVLDWNKPAHQFYRKVGACPVKEWVPYRITLRSDAF